MPTPRKGYFLKDGTQVPGTTTICGAYKDSGALIHWAWLQGKEGQDYRETRDKAGSIGSAAHAMIEATIRGDPLPPGPPEAHKAFDAYQRWAQQSKIEIVANEIQLVSHEYRYGGTPDAIGEIDGRFVLLDWKTSKGVYKNYMLQLAAYKNLWEEDNPDLPITGAYLVRFSKTDATCEPYEFSLGSLGVAWEQFKLFRQAYDLEKTLDRELEEAKSCMKPL